MSDNFRRVNAYLNRTIQQGLIPGAVLRIQRDDDVLYETALGLRHTAPARPMELDTLFDVASLTKVVATLGTLLELFEQQIITPDDTLGQFLPLRDDKRGLTIRQCLAHIAGLPAIIHLQRSVDEIAAVPLEYEPGTRVVYSDLGFLLLGRLIEVVTGTALDQAVHARMRAWGLDDTRYCPTDVERCAATEWRPELGRHQLGEVHDENAAVLGGVAGQAGLFSTARDLARYGTLFLPGRAGPWRERSRECQTEGLNDRRGLGWQLWQPGCFASDLSSPGGFGHTGFTGTSLWIDPERMLVIVLLTNRVHFGRLPHILTIRPQVHRLIYEALED